MPEMKRLFLFIVFLSVVAFSKAQTDTIVGYLNESWERVPDAGRAMYKTKVFNIGKKWHKQIFEISNDGIIKESIYSDKELNNLIDTSFDYLPDHSIKEYFIFKGKTIKSQLVDTNNRVVDYFIYDKKGNIIEQSGYSSSHNEITEKEAEFPHGLSAWQHYLKKKLRKNVPVKNNAPVGTYTVIVSFLIDSDGYITEAKPILNPGFGTAEELIRVILKSPRWHPATISGKPVSYRQKQIITFTVSGK